MSIAYNRKKKDKRRERNKDNPERGRIYRLIRNGVYPRFRLEIKVNAAPKNKERAWSRRLTIVRQVGVFQELTKELV